MTYDAGFRWPLAESVYTGHILPKGLRDPQMPDRQSGRTKNIQEVVTISWNQSLLKSKKGSGWLSFVRELARPAKPPTTSTSYSMRTCQPSNHYPLQNQLLINCWTRVVAHVCTCKLLNTRWDGVSDNKSISDHRRAKRSLRTLKLQLQSCAWAYFKKHSKMRQKTAKNRILNEALTWKRSQTWPRVTSSSLHTLRGMHKPKESSEFLTPCTHVCLCVCARRGYACVTLPCVVVLWIPSEISQASRTTIPRARPPWEVADLRAPSLPKIPATSLVFGITRLGPACSSV